MISKVATVCIVLAALGVVESRNVCKLFVGGKLYNIEPILPAIHLNLNQNVSAHANLCEGLSLDTYVQNGYKIVKPEKFKDKKPNSLLINNETKVVNCMTFMNDQDDDFWKVSTAQWPAFSPLIVKAASSESNSSQEIVVQSVNLLSFSDKLSSVKFKFKCERDPAYAMRDFYFDRKSKELIYGYSGPDACPLEIPDYVVFFSNNVLFLGLLFCSSVLGLFLGRSFERLAMSLTSLQAAVMVTSAILIATTQSHNFKSYVLGKEKYFGLALISISFLFFGLSYFSRYIAVFFVCISVSYSLTWTVLYISTVIFHSAVSFVVLGICTTCLFIVVVAVNTGFPQLRERYSFGVYTAITNPFFLVMSVGIYLGFYLDVISFNQYAEWGKIDSVHWKSWTPIAAQCFLSLVLITKSCFDSRSSRRIRTSTSFKKLTEQLNEDKNFVQEFGWEERRAAPSAIIQM